MKTLKGRWYVVVKAYTCTHSGAQNHRKSTKAAKPGFYMSYYSCKLFAI